jgi:uncharacterized protein YdcH (DUF465 family)
MTAATTNDQAPVSPHWWAARAVAPQARKKPFQRMRTSSAADRRRPRVRVMWHNAEGGWLMFENQQKDDVDALIKADSEFRSLYQRHQELDSKVRDAELGVLPLDDTTLHNMKKEKLWAKDKLIHLWERHRSLTH